MIDDKNKRKKAKEEKSKNPKEEKKKRNKERNEVSSTVFVGPTLNYLT